MLNSLPSVTYYRLQGREVYRVQCNGSFLCVERTKSTALKAEMVAQAQHMQLNVTQLPLFEGESCLSVVAEYLFGHCTAIEAVTFKHNDKDLLSVRRQDFFQQPEAWLAHPRVELDEDEWTETEGRAHPIRPTADADYSYRRYIPSLAKTLSFRRINVDQDLSIFHQWHNQPRVAALWELNWPIERLKSYLESGLQDPHQIPLILEIDGESAGYFEIYWAAEDRLGPYYDCEPYDRGFHFLIGNKKFLGSANTDAVIRSIMHFLYLDDPRTQRIVAEPKSDNRLVLKYAFQVPGWRLIKEFDFPHKRAALLMADRVDFFAGGAP